MSKTIQVRVEDNLKETADLLFDSLGLDTSTAVRMFLVAAIQNGGIPFSVIHKPDRDEIIREAIEYRKNGGKFISAEEMLADLSLAIERGASNGV